MWPNPQFDHIYWGNHCVKSAQYGLFSGPNAGNYGPEKTLYLDTFDTVNP